MSNQIQITPTKFTDLRNSSISYGFIWSDDYGCGFYDSWDNPPPDDDLQFLTAILEQNEIDTVELLEHIWEHEKGVYIGNIWYEWTKIKPTLESYFNKPRK